MGSSTSTHPKGFSSGEVMFRLAQRGVMLRRESLAVMSDELGIGRRRPIDPATGRAGNRYWTGDDIDILANAVELRRDFSLSFEDVRRVLRDEAAPEEVAAPLLAKLRYLKGRQTAA